MPYEFRKNHPNQSLLRLGNDGLCRIRPVGPDDRNWILQWFEGLSSGSRRTRFFTAKAVLSEAEIQQNLQADGNNGIALLALRLDTAGNECEALGLVCGIRRNSGASTAEYAVAVVDAWQHHSIGRALMDRLAERARAVGITNLYCDILAENRAMRSLAKSLGSDLVGMEGGCVAYDCKLGAATDETTSADRFDPFALSREGTDGWASSTRFHLNASVNLARIMAGDWLKQLPAT